MSHDPFADLTYCPICLTKGKMFVEEWGCDQGHFWPMTLDAFDLKYIPPEEGLPEF